MHGCMTVILYFIVIQWSQKTGPADQTRPRIAKKHIAKVVTGVGP